jgi:ornithine--oxo-acid transaminase
LSGGHVPVGAVLTHKRIFDKVFNSMVRAVVHGSAFSKNDPAMAAGLATLEVIESERLIERSVQLGERLLRSFQDMSRRHLLIRSVRGKGLMIGIEFGPPRSPRLRASWNLLETASSGLFCQLIVIPLFNEHKLLTQVAGHGNHTIKLLRFGHRGRAPYDRDDLEPWQDAGWYAVRARTAARGEVLSPKSRRGAVVCD